MTGELLITLDEAARRLSLCRRSVQELIYDGEIPSVKVGRSRRIATVDVETYVERLRQGHDNVQTPASPEGRRR